VPVAGGWDARGCWRVDGDRVLITELAPGYTKTDYLEHLEACRVRKDKDLGGAQQPSKRQKRVQFVVEVHDRSTHSTIEIELLLDSAAVAQLGKPLGELLHLQDCKQSHISAKNLVVMIDDKPQRFGSAEAIIDAYYPLRLAAYAARLAHQRAQCAVQIDALLERRRFVELVRAKKINLGASKAALRAQLRELGFAEAAHKALLAMSCGSFTPEKVIKLDAQISAERAKLAERERQTPQAEWRADLAAFRAAYPAYLERKRAVIAPSDEATAPKAKAARKPAARKPKQ
jgi:hypothetical protein